MDVSYIILLFLIGVIGSIISGMVGIGGSIIKYPMLLYIPALLGFVSFTAQEVSAINAVQVFFATLVGMFAFRKGGYINRALVITMGGAMIIGSFIGGYGSKFLENATINLVYAMIALIAAIMIFLPKKTNEEINFNEIVFNKTLAAAAAFVIGGFSGIVGAAGGFITIPVMLVLLKIPTRVAIASSFAITFISSIGSTAGKLLGGHMLLIPSLIMVIASLVATPLGVKISKKMKTKSLQWVLATLILATVVNIWWGILPF
ncbi:sulfite exporter TauE/SafE family protein [Metabacillus arenae]|uniref:Probable membrane transporter protein n=1 Tax=Metabacillus arenae TaxID=2771434 RepID=A0A926RY81_9BACI|nr:sulfite exporter TauE/SafE family protein [Metabacillus arenae]MBD1381781.1 sulfite exporter TauE/SafE family protein [Metabacillus arenae]